MNKSCCNLPVCGVQYIQNKVLQGMCGKLHSVDLPLERRLSIHSLLISSPILITKSQWFDLPRPPREAQHMFFIIFMDILNAYHYTEYDLLITLWRLIDYNRKIKNSNCQFSWCCQHVNYLVTANSIVHSSRKTCVQALLVQSGLTNLYIYFQIFCCDSCLFYFFSFGRQDELEKRLLQQFVPTDGQRPLNPASRK